MADSNSERPIRLDRPPVTTATPGAFRIEAITPHVLERIRAAGLDDHGNPLHVRIDADGGSPLRCCLRPAEPGAHLALIAYGPFDRTGPYAEVGPVFIHAERCPGYGTTDQYPPGFRHWPTMIFRPYHYDGRMAYPALAMVDGSDAEEAIEQIFGDPTIEMIHTRNLYAGCFMFGIHRPPGDPRPG